MKVLVVGGGGREHALAWKLSACEGVEEVLVAPGNAGTARETALRNVEVSVTDFDGLVKLVQDEGVAFTVVGPEQPLVGGIVDRFTAEGLPCFGPSMGAAQLEGSKAFTKEFMARYDIPTAAYATFDDVARAQVSFPRLRTRPSTTWPGRRRTSASRAHRS